jgi:hypothetical protein
MTARTETRMQAIIARTFLAVATILILLGLFWYGISAESQQRMWLHVFGRSDGPMMFRFILQPLMATLAALIDGITDAREGRSPYLWTILTDPRKRGGRLHEGLIATARILLLGIGMDLIYQYRVFDTFFPIEALIIALLLAFIPYLLLRGPVARIARWWMHRGHADRTHKQGG